MIKFYRNVLTENQKKMFLFELKELGKGILIILGIFLLGYAPM